MTDAAASERLAERMEIEREDPDPDGYQPDERRYERWLDEIG